MIYLDSERCPFKLNQSGEAIYTWAVRKRPTKFKTGTSEDHAAFDEEQKLLWLKVTQHQGLMAVVARKFPDVDRSVGLFALLNAARLFDPNKNRAFSTYAVQSIHNAFVSAKKKASKEVVEDFGDVPVEQITPIDVDSIMGRLDDQDRALLILRFWGKLTYTELAETLEVSRALVHAYVKRAIERCRVISEEMET